MNYPRIIAAVAGTPWAIEPVKGHILAQFFQRKANGEPIPIAEIQAAAQQKKNGSNQRSAGEGVVLIPVYGVLTQRADIISEASGLMSAEQIGRAVDEAAADPTVSTIILDIDSPGGSVYGVAEVADKIAAAAKKKKVIAVANSLAASGAYWIASQASELVVSTGGEVGSIGVYQMHVDQSKLLDGAGVKVTYIKAGRLKTAGNPYEPLTTEAAAELQKGVDDYYDLFIRAVARGRNTTLTKVRTGFGQGGMLRAKEAVAEGMADRVATLDSVLADYGLRLTDQGLVFANATRPVSSSSMDIAIRWRRLQLDGTATTSTATTTPARPALDPVAVHASWHESGHLFCRHVLGDRLAHATIVPSEQWSGACFPGQTLDPFSEAVTRFAGMEAQLYSPARRPFGSGPSGDVDQQQIEQLPLHESYHPKARERARSLVNRNLRVVGALAGVLQERRTIDAATTQAVLSRFDLFID